MPRPQLMLTHHYHRDSAFLAALKQALSPSSPRRRLREAVLLLVGSEALPRLAAGVDTLSLSLKCWPPSLPRRTRRASGKRRGMASWTCLSSSLRYGEGKPSSGGRGEVLYFLAYQASHPFVSLSLLPTPRPANPRMTGPVPLLSMPWTRCWRQGHHVR